MANPPTPNTVWDVRFFGSVEVENVTLAASFYLLNGAASVCLLDPPITGIALSALFNHFLAPQTWPAELLDLSLTNTSIYYRFSSGALPSTLPTSAAAFLKQQDSPGLFVSSTLKLDLAEIPFPAVAAAIAIESGAGLTLDADILAAVSVIDAGFLQLSGPGFTGGPHLSVISRTSAAGAVTRQFTLDCSYTFFRKNFGSSKITVSSGPALLADLAGVGKIGPFTDPRLTLSWSKAEGFRILNFPELPFEDAIHDIESLLDKVSAAKGCGSIGKLAGEAIKGNCAVKTHVTTQKPETPSGLDDAAAYIVIEGFFNIVAGGQQVASVPMPTLALVVKTPSTFSFDTLGDAILAEIQANAQQVVEELWNDREQLVTVLAIIGGAEALSQAASQLSQTLCDELRDFLEQCAQDLVETLLEEAFAEILGDLGVALMLAAIADVLLNAFTPGPNALPAPAVTVTCDTATSSLRVVFAAVTGAAGYQMMIRDAQQRLIGGLRRLPSGPVDVSIPIDVATVPAGPCVVYVRAIASAGAATDSAYGTATIQKLNPPAHVSASYDQAKDVLTAAWDSTGAAQYVVTLRAVSDGTVFVTANLNAPAGGAAPSFSHDFPASDLATTGSADFRVGVQAFGGPTQVPSARADVPRVLQRISGAVVVKGIGSAQIGSTFIVG